MFLSKDLILLILLIFILILLLHLFFMQLFRLPDAVFSLRNAITASNALLARHTTIFKYYSLIRATQIIQESVGFDKGFSHRYILCAVFFLFLQCFFLITCTVFSPFPSEYIHKGMAVLHRVC